jgi:hypothetical protein
MALQAVEAEVEDERCDPREERVEKGVVVVAGEVAEMAQVAQHKLAPVAVDSEYNELNRRAWWTLPVDLPVACTSSFLFARLLRPLMPALRNPSTLGPPLLRSLPRTFPPPRCFRGGDRDLIRLLLPPPVIDKDRCNDASDSREVGRP